MVSGENLFESLIFSFYFGYRNLNLRLLILPFMNQAKEGVKIISLLISVNEHQAEVPKE
jgi:hypothetical protein